LFLVLKLRIVVLFFSSIGKKNLAK
jgi:hypothetical protein